MKMTRLQLVQWQLLLCFLLAAAVMGAVDELTQDLFDVDGREVPENKEKNWFIRNTVLPGGITLPLSPITLFTVLLGLIHTFLNWGTYSWCEASHILLKEHSDSCRQVIREVCQEVGSDYKRFQDIASQLSDCPSRKNGGDLGRFYRGDMAKNFDKACFDPKIPVGKCVGPIETSFGWHCIYIRDRSI
jgi:peptidyl-prolyl cis-trans isomerase C